MVLREELASLNGIYDVKAFHVISTHSYRQPVKESDSGTKVSFCTRGDFYDNKVETLQIYYN